ncbi:hypothetical protein HK104_005966 [Borealophlyctis nickersoniae]|nr:hypothetical protein HK104_005966 [Borealophlyctis nickersoniae]
MSKDFSLDSLISKKGHIFVQGASRESVSRESIITRLLDTELTTAELLDQVKNLYHIKLKADDEIDELRNILAERLRKEDFGYTNFVGVDFTKKLQRFIDNTEVFEWFAEAHSDVGDKMKTGLAERRGTHVDEWIRKLEEQLREKDRQLALCYQPNKRVRVEQAGGREESDGRDDNGMDAVDDGLNGLDTDVDMDYTGGGSSVATNTRETIEREVRAEYDRKLEVEVQKVKDDAERQVAARAKEIERNANRRTLLADQKRVQDLLDAYQRKYDNEKDKCTKDLQAATDSAVKQQLQSKLEAAKTKYETYVKRRNNQIEGFSLRIQRLDETGDMGGPSNLDETEDIESAFE